MKQVESRKAFLKRGSTLFISLLGLSIIPGCRSSGEEKEGTTALTDPCKDRSKLDKNDLEARQKFNYVSQSPLKNKNCAQCNLYIPGVNESCGGCMLFKGPVEAAGSCTYWAPKTDPT